MALLKFLCCLAWATFAPIFSSAVVVLPGAFSNLKIHPSLHIHDQLQQQQQQLPLSDPMSKPTPLPLVIWHGLGDSYDADGIKETVKIAAAVHPGTYVHVVQLGDTGSSDRTATFLGNLTDQVQDVCSQLARDNILRTAPAINALGFSQGGQFLRAYVERCNLPPVRNLVTFGSQHNGISEFQRCASSTDFVCQSANALLRFGTWTPFVQSRLVPAQYFRDPEELTSYLESSNFLADVNNERTVKNSTYAKNMARLNKFVMYMFTDDKTVIPKQSSWFAEYNKTTDVVTPLAQRTIFRDDWLGLRKLAEKGGLVFDLLEGEHMRFSDDDLKKVMRQYFAPVQIDEQGNISDHAQPDA